MRSNRTVHSQSSSVLILRNRTRSLERCLDILWNILWSLVFYAKYSIVTTEKKIHCDGCGFSQFFLWNICNFFLHFRTHSVSKVNRNSFFFSNLLIVKLIWNLSNVKNKANLIRCRQLIRPFNESIIFLSLDICETIIWSNYQFWFYSKWSKRTQSVLIIVYTSRCLKDQKYIFAFSFYTFRVSLSELCCAKQRGCEQKIQKEFLWPFIFVVRSFSFYSVDYKCL